MLAAAGRAGAEEPTLTADRLEYLRSEDAFVATGGARLLREGAFVEADRIVYRRGPRVVEAEGRVLLRDGETVLSADRIRMDLETGLGEAEGEVSLFLVEEGVQVRGEALEKRGRDRYLLRRGTVTTCEGEDPDWSFRASTAELDLGRSLSGTHVRFHVGRLPVFYSPWFWAPVLLRKQSGLLFPDFGYSDRNGFRLDLRYYWMMAVNRDLTVHLDLMSERGLGAGAEFRYLEEFGASGRLRVWGIDDSRTDHEYVELKGVHEQRFGRTVRGYLRGAYLTRRDQYLEFVPSQEDKLRRYLENVAHLSWQPGVSRLYATGRVFQNLDGSSEGIPVTAEAGGRFYARADLPVPVYLDLDARADRFRRDLGAEGDRLFLRPVLLSAVQAPGLTIRPVLGWEGRWYDLEDREEAHPTVEVRRVGVSATSKLFRDFGPVRHVVEPELTYDFVKVRGDTPPLFDSLDQAGERHAASFRLVNRLYAGGRERFRLELEESHDLRAESRPWSNLDADLLARAGGFSFTGRMSYDVYENDVDTARAGLRYGWDGNFVAASNTFERTRVDTVTLEARLRPFRPLTTYGRVWYDAAGGGLREFELRLDYRSQCWGLYVEYVSRPEENRVMANISLAGLGSLGYDEAFPSHAP